MIRPLRRAHRRIVLLLALLLPLVLLAALALRADAPVQSDWVFEEAR